MLNQIAAALKISLAECKDIQDPTEYANAIVATLTRYKTNIFKMICKEMTVHQDPKEIIQFRIGGSFRSVQGFNKRASIHSSDIVVLYIGVIFPNPEGRMNREKIASLSVDITDIIDQEKILGLTPNCHMNCADAQKAGIKDEIEVPGLYHSMERGADDINSFIFQFNSRVAEEMEMEIYLAKAVNMPNDPRKSINELNGIKDRYPENFPPKSALDIPMEETIRDKQIRLLKDRIGEKVPGSRPIKKKRKQSPRPVKA